MAARVGCLRGLLQRAEDCCLGSRFSGCCRKWCRIPVGLWGFWRSRVGVAVLWCIDHFVHPICPSCSHSHNHEHCRRPPLHGFAGLLIATGLHSVLDGWSIQMLASNGFAGLAAPLGLALHKIPEGLALGLVARESIDSTAKAFWACVAAEL